MTILNALGALLQAVLKLGPLVWAYVQGKRTQELEQLRHDAKALDQAKRIRDRLDSDPAFAERVRERFRR